MTRTTRLLAAVVAAGACIGGSGCGDADTGNPIPAGKASTMERQLDAVQNAVDDGNCEDVAPAVNSLQATIGTLDSNGVGDDVRNALADGTDNLRSLAVSECGADQQDTTTTTTPEPTTPTITTPPPTTPPPTTPPPTTPTPTTPVPTPTTPDEGDGGGQLEPGNGTAIPPGQAKKGGGGG